MPKSAPRKRRAPPSAEDTRTVEIKPESFGKRLQQLLEQKGMNYSDLARLVWGKVTTKDGYEVAKNRDRISVYVAGKAFPDARNLKKIADHLGVEVADLAPDRASDAMLEHRNPAYSVTKAGENNGKVLLRVNKLVSEKVALEIIRLITSNHDALLTKAIEDVSD